MTQPGEGEKNHSFSLEVSAEQGGEEPSFNSLLSLPDVREMTNSILVCRVLQTFLGSWILWADLWAHSPETASRDLFETNSYPSISDVQQLTRTG